MALPVRWASMPVSIKFKLPLLGMFYYATDARSICERAQESAV
jgi:hypothetical protein